MDSDLQGLRRKIFILIEFFLVQFLLSHLVSFFIAKKSAKMYGFQFDS